MLYGQSNTHENALRRTGTVRTFHRGFKGRPKEAPQFSIYQKGPSQGSGRRPHKRKNAMSTKQTLFARFAAILVLCAVFAAFVASAPQAAQKVYSPATAKVGKIHVGHDVVFSGTIAELNDEFFLQLPGQEVYYKLDGIHDYTMNGAEVVIKGTVKLVNQSEAVINVRQYEITGGNQPAAAPVTL